MILQWSAEPAVAADLVLAYARNQAAERQGRWTDTNHAKSGMHYKGIWPLTKRANRGFRGYPVATVAFYGPDDRRASKVAVGIVPAEQADATDLERWFSADRDIRDDLDIAAAIQRFIEKHGAKTVVLADRIIGCPHEEGVDYARGATCPQCPFWADRERWSGDRLQ